MRSGAKTRAGGWGERPPSAERFSSFCSSSRTLQGFRCPSQE